MRNPFSIELDTHFGPFFGAKQQQQKKVWINSGSLRQIFTAVNRIYKLFLLESVYRYGKAPGSTKMSHRGQIMSSFLFWENAPPLKMDKIELLRKSFCTKMKIPQEDMPIDEEIFSWNTFNILSLAILSNYRNDFRDRTAKCHFPFKRLKVPPKKSSFLPFLHQKLRIYTQFDDIESQKSTSIAIRLTVLIHFQCHNPTFSTWVFSSRQRGAKLRRRRLFWYSW